MFCCNGSSGKYPAVSITGSQCQLQCAHCQGKILSPMISAPDPEGLLEVCLELEGKGNLGVLVSGGCDEEGRLPWGAFIPALKEVTRRTGLDVSIHCGFVDEATAFGLKDAGIDQVLIDVIGDDSTYREIYHLESGVSRLLATLKALTGARLTIVPHIVCGLHHGKMKGEKNAIEIVAGLNVPLLVVVSFMRIPNTPMWNVAPPAPEEIVALIAEARLRMPGTEVSLGCARPRGNHRLETLAIDAGVNRMALPSEEALERARFYGLEMLFQKTCCSVTAGTPNESWQN
jgi:lipoyl synthase